MRLVMRSPAQASTAQVSRMPTGEKPSFFSIKSAQNRKANITDDVKLLVQDQIELVVQVNGKLRGHIQVPANATREQIESAALAHEAVIKFTNGQKPRKVVVVPGRLVNVVV